MLEILKRIMLIIFPEKCIFCLEITDGENCCQKCEQSMQIIKKPICKICGSKKDRCRCRKKMEYLRSVGCFYYEGNARNGIKELKFRGNKRAGIKLSEYLYQSYIEHLAGEEIDYIIPIPMYKSKKKKRGYNQSEILAENFAKLCNIKYNNTNLIKIVNNKIQHTLAREKRESNVKNVYKLKNPEQMKDKNIILIDDVLTTGNTANSCANALKKAGANNIYVLTITLA